ncbi:ABC transporter ATP-binding protein/permease [Caulobacter sp. S45]|uniref:ABCB family ABC transporter ATP-binding protein/permease n=1 Tax=Caulobacter sp. S45 TaxID=1641861 RepID=UPI001C206EBD|nr:ABC transporter ATP-binding protein/permease [Caulobacter sp. S45]
MRSWASVAMRDAPGAPAPASGADQLKALRSLGPHLWPKGEPLLKARVVAALCLVFLAKLFNVAIPLLLKRAVDALAPHGHMALIAAPLGLVAAYGAARIGSQGSGEIRDMVFAPVVQRAVRRTAIETLDRLHGLSLRFHLERYTGGVSRIMDRGLSAVEVLLGLTLFNVAPILLEVTLVSAILWRLFNPAFAAATIAVIVGYAAFTFAVTQRRVSMRREMNRQDNLAGAVATDSLINYETVKYFGAEHHEVARYDAAKRDYERSAVKNQATLSGLNIGQGLIMTAGLVAVMMMAAVGVAHGRMTVGDFVLVNAYMLQLYQPLNVLGVVYRSLKQSLVDYEQMHRLLRTEAEVQDRPGAGPLVDPGGEIVFEDVGFSYEPRRSILSGVSFRVPPGRKVALVGTSGAGKSTIARLLFRFYDATSGKVTIGGEDLRDVTQASLRAAIGVVPQDTVLFNDTLYYNIAYGRPDATREEVVEAARLAHLHDFVAALPDGYETMVGERGLKLSGGEKQRVAIARVILKRPRILIFDEATSALDTKTEQGIQESLRELAIGHTSLVIAHRLSTVTDADEILVLEQGRIIERGTHAGLLRKDGVYAGMWARQHRGTEEPVEA